MGAADDDCQPNGQCICRVGAAGLKCDSCQEESFGLSANGCDSCNCHPLGSTSLQCNLTTGMCSCKPGVGGDKCNECLLGFYKFSSLGCSGELTPDLYICTSLLLLLLLLLFL